MKIEVTEYLHARGDSFADWEMEQEELGNYDRDSEAASKLRYRLYEVAVTMEIDLETGEYTILKAEDGPQVLTP